MKSITINIPENAGIEKQEILLLLAAKLYEKGKLTLSQGAEMAGYSKSTFMELLGGVGVSVINYSPDELENDILNASRYHNRR